MKIIFRDMNFVCKVFNCCMFKGLYVNFLLIGMQKVEWSVVLLMLMLWVVFFVGV